MTPPDQPPATTAVADPADALFHLMYQDLRRLARSRLRRSENITLLDTTALVHESYLRFQHDPGLPALSEGQFLAYAARTMRFVVIDFVRQRHAQRRGGGQLQVTLNTEAHQVMDVDDSQVLRIHEALEELSQVDDRLARIVEMRCFGGLDDLAIGQALGVTDRTVRREWQKARLLLQVALQ